MNDVTLILQRLARGETAAEAELLPAVYTELRRVAAGQMAREPAGQTLQATALVHEAWLRLGGGQERVDLDGIDIAAPAAHDDRLLDVNAALDRFAALEPQKAEFVKLRYFVGLTLEEAAATLDISPATAKRWWVYARSWLYRELHPDTAAGAAAPPAVLPP